MDEGCKCNNFLLGCSEQCYIIDKDVKTIAKNHLAITDKR